MGGIVAIDSVEQQQYFIEFIQKLNIECPDGNTWATLGESVKINIGYGTLCEHPNEYGIYT